MQKRSFPSRARLLHGAILALLAGLPVHAANDFKPEKFEGCLQRPKLDLKASNTEHSPSNMLFGGVSATTFSGSIEGADFPDNFHTRSFNSLSERDIYLLVDHTSSMMREDCPDGTTRWDWLRKEVAALSDKLEQRIRGGISLVPFATDFKIYRQVKSTQVKSILRRIVPSGSTHPENALEKIFDSYFAEREINPKVVRPLLVVILSDGIANEPDAVIDVISKATSRMIDRREIVRTFLQVSNDDQGASIMEELDNDLVRRREACFDIINKRTFRELQSIGLENCLTEAFDESVQACPLMISSATKN